MHGGWAYIGRVAAALLTLALGACGDSGDSGNQARQASSRSEATTTTTAPEGDATSTTTVPSTPSTDLPGEAVAPEQGSQSAADPQMSPREIDARLGDIELVVEFSSPCIRVGQSQTITIRTEPEIGVAYHAIYADGKNGYDPDYYGGNNGGQADEAGRYSDTWVLKPGAPPGHVRVDVVAKSASDSGYQEAGFEVAGANGQCS